jgi:hypothetical protein
MSAPEVIDRQDRVIAPLTWRLDFTGAGAPHTNCQWVIWDRLDFITTFELLRKPSGARPEKDSEVEKILMEAGLVPVRDEQNRRAVR